MSISEVFSIEMGCLEPAGILEQEGAYLAALGTVDSYQITDGRLEMFDNAGVQILVFVASTSETLAEDEMSTNTTPKLSLGCTLAMDETYPAGEPVGLVFELHNQTDHQLHVLNWYTPLEGIAGDIFQVTQNGEKLPYQGLQVKRGDPIQEYVAIESGQVTSAEVDLRMGYDLSMPGSYQVQFTTGPWDVTDDASRVPRKRDDHQPQLLACNTASFQIVPTPEPATATLTPERPAGF